MSVLKMNPSEGPSFRGGSPAALADLGLLQSDTESLESLSPVGS